MRLAILLVAASALAAQDGTPPAIVRGNLLECDTAPGAGEFSVRTGAHQVFRFRYDAKTYFEREGALGSAAKLVKGDLVEVVADRVAQPALRYARTVHVLDREPPRRTPVSQGRYRAYRGTYEPVLPIGDLTLAGVVARVGDGSLLLRTRKDGEKTVRLRQDTRYLESGREVAASALRADTLVFVRGSRNFDDEFEAYQVIWGEILEPDPRR